MSLIAFNSAIVIGIALFPFLVIGLALCRNKVAMLGLLITFVIGQSLLFTVVVIDNARLHPTLTTVLYGVGPSMYSIRHAIFPILAWTIWLPTSVAFCLVVALRFVLRLNTKSFLLGYANSIASVVAVIWTIIVCFYGEYTHEDTLWAKGFKQSRWDQIQVGMKRTDVYLLVGSPLTVTKPEFFPNARFEERGVIPDLWATHGSAGYVAAVWFTNEVVVRKSIRFME